MVPFWGSGFGGLVFGGLVRDAGSGLWGEGIGDGGWGFGAGWEWS